MEVMYKSNITFLEVRRVDEPYMKENTNFILAQRANSIDNDKQSDKYKTLIEELLQLGSYD